jgi:hypothetical protein
LWKVLGAAAFIGVAATGVAIARAERRRRAYTPEEIRARLHARLAEVSDPRLAGDDHLHAQSTWLVHHKRGVPLVRDPT